MRIKSKFVNEGWTRETPSGSIDGSNKVFTVAHKPDDPNGVEVYLDGLLETEYTISDMEITFVTAPAPGQTITVTYTRST